MSNIDRARDKLMMGLEREGVQISDGEKKRSVRPYTGSQTLAENGIGVGNERVLISCSEVK